MAYFRGRVIADVDVCGCVLESILVEPTHRSLFLLFVCVLKCCTLHAYLYVTLTTLCRALENDLSWCSYWEGM